ncbi:hypothetical protein V8C35DRAFT_55693 [Trichoderma chlorosporum]
MEEINCINDSILLSASNDHHFPDCSADCWAHFLSSLASNREASANMCQTLPHIIEDRKGDSPILYCYGSHWCQMRSIEDLSVRRFLSSCQRNDDDDSITDPISLGQAPVRSSSIADGKEHARRQQQQPTTPIAALPAVTPSGFIVEGFHTITTKASPPLSSEMAHSITASEPPVTHLAATTETSKPLRHRTGGKSQVPSTTKVTIGVSVMVGILAVVAVIIWHLKMKTRFRNKKRISRPIKPSSLPPTPLISPSSSYAGPPGGPLTPPPRLQERRFLLTRALSLRRNNHRRQYNDESPQEWAGVPLSPMPPLSPPSPLSISRTRRNPEQGDRGGITATTTISQTTSVTVPPRDDIAPGASVSSVFSSASTLRATSNASADSAQIRYSGATATELPRPPPLVYEAPPAVHGLASPGPPPTRALPSLPADGRASPLKSPPTLPTSPNRRVSPSFVTVTRSSVGTGERSRDSQRSGEQSSQGGGGASTEVSLQSPRRVRHVRSPLLNEVCLNGIERKE